MKAILLSFIFSLVVLAGNAQISIKYAYDKNNRLKGFEYPTFIRSYFYDQTGNLVKKNSDPSLFNALPFNSPDKTINVFPNPLTGNVFFIVAPGGSEIKKVSLFDLKGAKIPLSTELTSIPASVKAVGQLYPGIYFLHVLEGKTTHTLKLVKLVDY